MKKYLFILWAALLGSGVALAQLPPGFSTYAGSGMEPLADPFFIYPYANSGFVAPFTNTSGYTPVSCTPAAEVTKVIIVAGQSNWTNIVGSAYSVTQAKNHHLNIYDGLCYQSKGILLGVAGSGTVSNVAAQLADKLITNDAIARVILVPMAIQGISVAQMANAQNQPYIFNQIAVVARRLGAQGLTATHVVWGQGEQDAAIGTSQASYTASLNIVIAGFRSAGISAPFLVNIETWQSGAANATIAAAQNAASGTNVFVGANLDSINNTGRQDTTHFNLTGAGTASGLVEAQVILH